MTQQAVYSDATQAAGEPIIRVENVDKFFGGFQALKDINMTVGLQEVVVVIGPSGGGKSTLIRCINRLEKHDKGRIVVDGIEVSDDVRSIQEVRRETGMVFQQFNLFPHKTILENVMLAPCVVRKQAHEDATANAIRLLEKVGLAEHKDRYPATLSGGQQQRAGIARALAMNPKVMLYDEPTSALDPELVDEVLQVMRALDAEGMTQIVVTHEIRFARDASDYIVFMEGGNIVEISDEDEIFTNPKDERTRRFLRRFI